MRMPFGQYKTWEIKDLPDGYLDWLVNEADIHSGWLKDELEREYDARRYGPGYQQQKEKNDRDRQNPWEQWANDQKQQHFHSEPPRTEGLDRIAGTDRDLFYEILQAGFRRVALKSHPDHGGSTEKMRRLNNLMAKLREHLKKP